MNTIRTLQGNSDANGSLDKAQPYMKETYTQQRARIAKEMAERAANQLIYTETPESNEAVDSSRV